MGTTTHDLALGALPVVSLLGGAALGYWAEGRKRREERQERAALLEQQRASAALSARQSAIAEVMTTAVTWRHDVVRLLAAVALGWKAAPEELVTVISSHATFGKAIMTASVRIEDRLLLDSLGEVSELYEEGFKHLHQLSHAQDRAGAHEALDWLDNMQSILGLRMQALRSAARPHFASQSAIT